MIETPNALRPSARECSSPSPAGAVARRAEGKHSSCRVQRMGLSAGHQMLRESSRGYLGTEVHTRCWNVRPAIPDGTHQQGLRLSCDYHFYPPLWICTRVKDDPVQSPGVLYAFVHRVSVRIVQIEPSIECRQLHRRWVLYRSIFSSLRVARGEQAARSRCMRSCGGDRLPTAL